MTRISSPQSPRATGTPSTSCTPVTLPGCTCDSPAAAPIPPWWRKPSRIDPAEWERSDPPLNGPDEFNSSWKAIRFDTGALGWHLVYVAGLVLLGVWLATRMANRGDDGAGTRWLLVVGIPLVLIGGVAQVLTAGVAT